DLAEQAAAEQAVGAEPLGDGEHHLPVGDRGEERRLQPRRPQGQPLGVTARAEIPALTRKGEQVLVRAVAAADAREAVTTYLGPLSQAVNSCEPLKRPVHQLRLNSNAIQLSRFPSNFA